MCILCGIFGSSLRGIRHPPYAIRHTSYVVRHASYVIHHPSYAIRHTSYAIQGLALRWLVHTVSLPRPFAPGAVLCRDGGLTGPQLTLLGFRVMEQTLEEAFAGGRGHRPRFAGPRRRATLGEGGGAPTSAAHSVQRRRPCKPECYSRVAPGGGPRASLQRGVGSGRAP